MTSLFKILTGILLGLSMAAMAEEAKDSAQKELTEITDQQVTTYTLKNEDGKTMKVSGQVSAGEVVAEFETPLHKENYFTYKLLAANCEKVKNDVVYRAEIQLELPIMMDELKREKVKYLSDNQKKFLSQVPLCTPFLTELKVIGLMLNGWNVEKVDIEEVKKPQNVEEDKTKTIALGKE